MLFKSACNMTFYFRIPLLLFLSLNLVVATGLLARPVGLEADELQADGFNIGCPEDNACNTWARNGACRYFPLYMRSTCAESCTRCTVEGQWSVWSDLGECSATCGGGTRLRYRHCDNPSPLNGGAYCLGRNAESVACNTQICSIAVDGQWGRWTDLGECSATCGGGTRLRYRRCDNPSPLNGGSICAGRSGESISCNTQRCLRAVDGQWSRWSNVGECSATCGGGTRLRSRKCDNPSPLNGGSICPGPSGESIACNTKACSRAVDGQWAPWGNLGECSATCGGGTRIRYRNCNNPSPVYGGSNCVGPNAESIVCNTQRCSHTVINGAWGRWTGYYSCSETCGGGSQMRWRTCDKPAPENGGSFCLGFGAQSRECNTQKCPTGVINGQWGEWSVFYACSVLCGGGSQRRYRTCDNPAPSLDGSYCAGFSSESQECNTNLCPGRAINGIWGDWAAFDSCSKSCGGGSQKRFRYCDNPAPSRGGSFCSGSKTESRGCNADACPSRDGDWGRWSEFNRCSKSCGGGSQMRSRNCDNPAPSLDGAFCSGSKTESRGCNDDACPRRVIKSTWAAWSVFYSCSKPCGGGIQTRYRNCDVVQGSEYCSGPHKDSRQCNTQKCGTEAINGAWGEWSRFYSCSKSCGGGLRVRYRSCDNPGPLHGGSPCPGLRIETSQCNTEECTTAIDGAWGKWADFNSCSKSCGGGLQVRYRNCDNPAPLHSGLSCPGFRSDSRECNIDGCPRAINGAWGTWSGFSSCSQSCGGGSQMRSRSCDDPAPLHGGSSCRGLGTDSRPCNTGSCTARATNGGWGAWSGFNSCSKPCGGGIRSRSRHCDNPAPSHDGSTCIGTRIDVILCNTEDCSRAVNGAWGAWSRFDACSRSCGGGSQKRSRSCDDPAPLHGGSSCRGLGTDSRPCNTGTCPVGAIDGAWGTWSGFDSCSKSCGGGSQMRSRNCDNPAPSHGGSRCRGLRTDSRQCNTRVCSMRVINGAWGAWSGFNSCSKSCGGGTLSRSRNCDNPAPSIDGSLCVGFKIDARRCNTEECPRAINGAWGAWSSFDSCSKSCGGGSQKRSRICDSPAPLHGGSSCRGLGTDSRPCNTGACRAINGAWGAWSGFNSCSKSCGGGTQSRSRNCDNPAPFLDGSSCFGLRIDARRCNSQECPRAINGAWGAWSGFSSCSKSCAGGTQKRSRNCDNPAPLHGGSSCLGFRSDTRECNNAACPRVINGEWGRWTSFHSCSKSCGGGLQKRFRNCDSPAPSRGGSFCSGSDTQSQRCSNEACPTRAVNGAWAEWGDFYACSKSCGGGSQVRYRNCDNPAPLHGGSSCPGMSTNSRSCNTVECPRVVHGEWGAWSGFNGCSKSCGRGLQTRSRNCDNPAPSKTGSSCSGSRSESRECHRGSCPVRVINGGWGQWSAFQSCSKSCDGGSQIRYRTCDDPAPQNGGSFCPGLGAGSRRCNSQKCPTSVINGEWGRWSGFVACSKTCGGGSQLRSRRCDNPAPSLGGAFCSGSKIESRQCNTGACPSKVINGEWGDWSVFYACSVSCGKGSERRYRSCDNPTPSLRGAYCVGSSSESQGCNPQACPSRAINGEWGRWSGFNDCSKTCGGGSQLRSRRCDNPTPSLGGAFCSGSKTESRECKTGACPSRGIFSTVDGEWGRWSSFNVCSKSCGGGLQTRSRNCDNPAPSLFGSFCSGSRTESRQCNTGACLGNVRVIDGKWGEWRAFSDCSERCGGGIKTRSRNCDNPTPSLGGASCSGSKTESVSCNVQACPSKVEGAWADWSGFSGCSVSCGGGARTRTRVCENRSPQQNQIAYCFGPTSVSVACNADKCPSTGKKT